MPLFLMSCKLPFLKTNNCSLAGQCQGTQGQALIEHLQHVMSHSVPEGSVKLHSELTDTWSPLTLHAVQGSVEFVQLQQPVQSELVYSET